MTEQSYSKQQLRDRGRVERLKPTESDLREFARKSRGRARYERYHEVDVGGERIKVRGEAPDGTYKWVVKFQGNEHGRATHEAMAVGEMIKPFSDADAKLRAASSSAALTDNGRSRGRSRTHGQSEECRAGERWCLTDPYPWTPVPEGGNPDGTWA